VVEATGFDTALARSNYEALQLSGPQAWGKLTRRLACDEKEGLSRATRVQASIYLLRVLIVGEFGKSVQIGARARERKTC
jgi:hypothetical protein